MCVGQAFTSCCGFGISYSPLEDECLVSWLFLMLDCLHLMVIVNKDCQCIVYHLVTLRCFSFVWKLLPQSLVFLYLVSYLLVQNPERK